MRPSRFRALAVLLALVAPTAARAQILVPPPAVVAELLRATDTTRLPSDTTRLTGRWIRAWRRDGTPIFGTVASVRGDTLVLRQRDASGVPRLVEARGLRRLDVSKPSQWQGRNALIGAALGAASGLVVYLNWCDKHPVACQASKDSAARDSTYYAVSDMMIFGGAFAGAALGWVLTPPSWKRVGVAVDAAIVPGRDGEIAGSVGMRVPMDIRRPASTRQRRR